MKRHKLSQLNGKETNENKKNSAFPAGKSVLKDIKIVIFRGSQNCRQHRGVFKHVP